MTAEQKIQFHYLFSLPNGAQKTFNVLLDPKTLDLIHLKHQGTPSWTKLSFHQCPNCPLVEARSPQCPIAANLVEVIDFFKDITSFEKVTVSIETEQRGYFKRTVAQEGMSSLIGIYMVTSGCPVMDKLRPLVRFHQPFATPMETLYRALSMYLMAQYFRKREGKKPDWDLEKLIKIYQEIHTVNTAFAERIRQATISDAGVNALVRTDANALFALFSFEEDNLKAIKNYFNDYLKDE